MTVGEKIAYLAGLLDGDGYLKIVKSRVHERLNYQIQIGIQQLWPGEVVRLFAQTFGGSMKPMMWPGHRTIARCELHSRRAAAALSQLSAYFLVKRDQSRLLLQLGKLKAQPKEGRRPYSLVNRRGLRITRSRPCFTVVQLASMDRLRSLLIALHNGDRGAMDVAGDRKVSKSGPETPWTREETLAYLAGIMDSDGSFRVEKKKVLEMLSPHYRINIRASQVTPSPAIELLAKTFGGKLTIKRTKRPNHRDLVGWGLHDGCAAAAISVLYPYLVVKKHEAELLLELRELKAQGKKGITEWVHANRWHPFVTMRKRCYTQDQVAEFERIHREVQALHSGGSATHRQDDPLQVEHPEEERGTESEG